MRQAMNKRPVCFLCLGFCILLSLFVYCSGFPPEQYASYDEQQMHVIGTVVNKEIKNDNQVVYLKNVMFYDMDNSLQQLNMLNEKDGSSKPGAICYLADDSFSMLRIGATISLNGKINCFASATNPGEFDAREYYYILGYHFRIMNGTVLASSEEYNHLKDGLFRFRKKMEEIYDAIFSEEDASVIKAMVLGEKSEMDRDIKQLYQSNGIAHILAISGLHVGIIGMGLFQLFRKMRIPLPICVGISFLLLLLYSEMTMGSASTHRAVIMLTFVLFSKPIWRTADPPTTISVAATIVLIMQPYYLYYAGFWLSFGAIIGITFFLPSFLYQEEKRKLQNKVQLFMRRQIQTLKSGVAISYFTMPILLYYYYEYPVYSILLNLVVIPLMTLLLAFSLLALFAGAFWLPLGCLLGYPCHLILLFYKNLCSVVSTWPYHTMILGRPAIWKILLYYGITFFIVAFHKKIPLSIEREKISLLVRKLLIFSRKMLMRVQKLVKYAWKLLMFDGKFLKNDRKVPVKMLREEKDIRILELKSLMKKIIEVEKMKKIILPWRSILMCFAVFVVVLRTPPELSITFLDVGQGDGICIQNENMVCFVDGGSSSKKELANYQIIPFLKYYGIATVNYWFLTHPDSDHCSGLQEILEMVEMPIKIETIILPDAQGSSEDFYEIIALAENKGIAVQYMARGQVLSVRKDISSSFLMQSNIQILSSEMLTIYCLHPETQYITQDVNDYSLVLWLQYGDFDMLLTGDATERSEKEILQFMEINQWGIDDLEVLKIGHHGSSTSSSEDFLTFFSPHISLISCGLNNRYGHPHEEVLKRLDEMGSIVYRTDENGAIRIYCNNAGIGFLGGKNAGVILK
ncbi:MAG: ComEC/Rec2 family competence protein [Lachnospiraceae bacterium]